ncbi:MULTISPECIES: hypothetical protein [Legionella]|uniref:Coiled-coil protein n=1 Tax=Legionella drozanskii LLAP-1 TaxID=1212489 RepID=A0A0W0SMH4_9GAMM|nr:MULTISPECIES: hypothetical protein [Legionella]KTC84560.1 hypothetical protein Ldro_2724 [Legionella drozanskii LLAP-1]PJE18361.1 MAG: hypothetical protein CK430_00435 [Legionella sp.]
MSAVSQRLQSLIGDTLEPCEEGTKTWVFRDKLEEKGVELFQPLVRIHQLLTLEYNVHCVHLMHSFADKSKQQEVTEDELNVLTDQLVAALTMAELLAHIYHYYLDVPYEVLRLQKEQKYYRELLRLRGYDFPNTEKLENDPMGSFSQYVRDTTRQYNWHRLFTIRIRRVFITLLPFILDWNHLTDSINGIDLILGPTLNYVAWLFYVPRLALNLFMLLKHLFLTEWAGMGAKEKDLYWLIRVEAQLQRRWFFLGNDTAWFICGILACFVLTGSLAPVGMYITISIFFFDVIMATIRALIELRRINEIREQYNNVAKKLRSSGASKEEIDEIEEYQRQLEEQFTCEQQRVMLGVISTSALFLAMCFAMPALASMPIIPLIGAILVVTITFATFLANRWIDSHVPRNNVEKIETPGKSLFESSSAFFQANMSSMDEKQRRKILHVSSEPGPLSDLMYSNTPL